MHDLTAKRTLVKSPPELWSELSEVERLARHLGAFGEIRITRLEPEHTVAWEGEAASGTVMIEPSGWGTKVTLKAQVEGAEPEPDEPEPEPQPEPEPEPEPEPQAELFPEEAGAVRRTGFFARLFAWGPKEEPVAARPEAIAEPEEIAEPEPEPEPQVEAEPEPDGALEAQAVLEEALEALGSAHHRPFSRG
jgi:hypothetical protein